ncbi:S26 family signal peptidase [Micromonospora sp. NPDC049102]|uniref:S26 family signal peptidase n=1 Tax=Micromonospora sp. NPDC049102 TaxID=3364265 RepID=UPI003718D6F7
MMGTTYVLAGCCCAAFVLALWVRRRLIMVAVDGSSMEPTFRSGDRILVRRTRLPRVRSQDVVVVRSLDQFLEHGMVPNNDARYMVKRAVAVPGDPIPREKVPPLASVTETSVLRGKLVLLGDNPQSYDSRHFGYYPGELLVGVAVFRLFLGRPRANGYLVN